MCSTPLFDPKNVVKVSSVGLNHNVPALRHERLNWRYLKFKRQSRLELESGNILFPSSLFHLAKSAKKQDAIISQPAYEIRILTPDPICYRFDFTILTIVILNSLIIRNKRTTIKTSISLKSYRQLRPPVMAQVIYLPILIGVITKYCRDGRKSHFVNLFSKLFSTLKSAFPLNSNYQGLHL